MSGEVSRHERALVGSFSGREIPFAVGFEKSFGFEKSPAGFIVYALHRIPANAVRD